MQLPARAMTVALASALAIGASSLTTGASASTAAGGGPADLTITYQSEPTAPTVTWVLRCPSRTGTHPAAGAACDLLESATTNLFAPVPPLTGCLTIWGGPQTARVVGVWRGKSVRASFSRTNSCEMYRWYDLVPVLPKV